ncbi:hypothetical protein M2T82_03535 [Elizabethkingia ursingii]|uniref:aspartate/glutamate racemase family protein n=1 Tax=Elizabethkingia ursingii TaxID=1756150 RepID=UPI0020112704|nr:aspartate/glutamate racemase family protein [Elizabethkingia ursingii]MCL1667130.1 hypothetical protein [Elizabethkingia ursingii]
MIVLLVGLFSLSRRLLWLKSGIEAVVLGCTEIPLLIKQEDISIPVLDTTKIHSRAAVDFALDKSSI